MNRKDQSAGYYSLIRGGRSMFIDLRPDIAAYQSHRPIPNKMTAIGQRVAELNAAMKEEDSNRVGGHVNGQTEQKSPVVGQQLVAINRNELHLAGTRPPSPSGNSNGKHSLALLMLLKRKAALDEILRGVVQNKSPIEVKLGPQQSAVNSNKPVIQKKKTVQFLDIAEVHQQLIPQPASKTVPKKKRKVRPLQSILKTEKTFEDNGDDKSNGIAARKALAGPETKAPKKVKKLKPPAAVQPLLEQERSAVQTTSVKSPPQTGSVKKSRPQSVPQEKDTPSRFIKFVESERSAVPVNAPPQTPSVKKSRPQTVPQEKETISHFMEHKLSEGRISRSRSEKTPKPRTSLTKSKPASERKASALRKLELDMPMKNVFLRLTSTLSSTAKKPRKEKPPRSFIRENILLCKAMGRRMPTPNKDKGHKTNYDNVSAKVDSGLRPRKISVNYNKKTLASKAYLKKVFREAARRTAEIVLKSQPPAPVPSPSISMAKKSAYLVEYLLSPVYSTECQVSLPNLANDFIPVKYVRNWPKTGVFGHYKNRK